MSKTRLLSTVLTMLFLSLLFLPIGKAIADKINATNFLTNTGSTINVEMESTNKSTLGVSSAPVLNDVNKINAPKIIAKNAVVYDIENKEFIYAKNANDPVPIASLAKIITATVFLQLNNGRRKQNNEIKIVKIIKKKPSYNQGDRGLIAGEEWKPENLIRYMLITSSNIAAQSLSNSFVDDEFAFALLMNKFTKDLGYKSFKFKNSSGLSTTGTFTKTETIASNATSSNITSSLKSIPSAFGSAKEVAVLFDYIFKNITFLGEASIIPEASFINWSGNTHTVKNVNYSIAQIPNIIAGKTGTTDESGGNLIIEINANNKKYAIVILGSTIEDRYNDAIKLASSTEAFATLK